MKSLFRQSGDRGDSKSWLEAYQVYVLRCLEASGRESFESLGAPFPNNVPWNSLVETWIEICGSGHRSSSFSDFRGIGLFGGDGAGGASASGTDQILVDVLVSHDNYWADSVDAMIDGYRNHQIPCGIQSSAR